MPMRRYKICTALAVTAAAAILDVGSVSVLAASPNKTAAQRALALWAKFPADAMPRPIVPINGAVVDPSSGFQTGDEKLAYLNGDFSLQATLPSGPQSRAQYRLRGSASALVLLRGHPRKLAGIKALRSSRVTLGSATFPTDRGDVVLPAWQFYFRGVKEPAAVLALVDAEVFTPPAPRSFDQGVSPYEDDAAFASGDGRELKLSFTGGPAGHAPCDSSYTLAANTSAHAVAVTIIAHPVSASAVCGLVGYRRTATVHLGQPVDDAQ